MYSAHVPSFPVSVQTFSLTRFVFGCECTEILLFLFTLLICMSRQFVDIFSVDDILQVLTVLVLLVDLVCGHNLFLGDPAVCVGDLFQARNLSVLVGLDGLNEVGCLN